MRKTTTAKTDPRPARRPLVARDAGSARPLEHSDMDAFDDLPRELGRDSRGLRGRALPDHGDGRWCGDFVRPLGEPPRLPAPVDARSSRVGPRVTGHSSRPAWTASCIMFSRWAPLHREHEAFQQAPGRATDWVARDRYCDGDASRWRGRFGRHRNELVSGDPAVPQRDQSGSHCFPGRIYERLFHYSGPNSRRRIDDSRPR